MFLAAIVFTRLQGNSPCSGRVRLIFCVGRSGASSQLLWLPCALELAVASAVVAAAAPPKLGIFATLRGAGGGFFSAVPELPCLRSFARGGVENSASLLLASGDTARTTLFNVLLDLGGAEAALAGRGSDARGFLLGDGVQLLSARCWLELRKGVPRRASRCSKFPDFCLCGRLRLCALVGAKPALLAVAVDTALRNEAQDSAMLCSPSLLDGETSRDSETSLKLWRCAQVLLRVTPAWEAARPRRDVVEDTCVRLGAHLAGSDSSSRGDDRSGVGRRCVSADAFTGRCVCPWR